MSHHLHCHLSLTMSPSCHYLFHRFSLFRPSCTAGPPMIIYSSVSGHLVDTFPPSFVVQSVSRWWVQIRKKAWKLGNRGIFIWRIDPEGVLIKKNFFLQYTAAYLLHKVFDMLHTGFFFIKWCYPAKNLETGIFLDAELTKKGCSSKKKIFVAYCCILAA